MIKLPPLPMHPDPHTYQWTERERITIIEYAAAVSAADNAALRERVKALESAITESLHLAGNWPEGAQAVLEDALLP